MNKSFISRKILPLALSAAMVIGNFATVYADEITDDYDIKTEGLDNSIDGQSDEDSVTGDTTYYTVHIADDIVNGKVYLKDGDDATTNDISVAAGDTVYVTAVEDEGYEFSDIKAYDIESQELQLTAQDDDVYYFTMPQSDVEVKAVFSKKETKDVSTKESSENTDDKSSSSVSQGGGGDNSTDITNPNQAIETVGTGQLITENRKDNFFGGDYVCLKVDGKQAYCLVSWANSPAGKTVEFEDYTRLTSEEHYQRLLKAMYYGYGGPNNILEELGVRLEDQEAVTHFAMAYIWESELKNHDNMGQSPWKSSEDAYEEHVVRVDGQTVVKNFIDKINSKPNVEGKLYIANLYDTEGVQDVAYAEFTTTPPPTPTPPVISTQAKSDTTGIQIVPLSDSENITDTVSYSNVVPGTEYTLKGTIVDQDNVNNVIATAEIKFTPSAANGTATVQFTKINTNNLVGKKLVIYEELWCNGNKVAEHKDRFDEKQMIYTPQVGTTAADKKTEDHVGMVDKETTLIDTVSYKGLQVDKEYTVKGVLMNKKTKKPILVDGKQVTAETTFTAKKSEGSVKVEFTFDTSKIAGESVVVFEGVYYKNIELCTHSDIDDTDQIVNYPKIHTKAVDVDTKTHVGTVKEKATIAETVSYSNVVVGKTYTISGILMDKDTGKAILENGKEITAKTTFTAENPDGTVELKYTLDSSVLNKKSIVVFEDLYYKNIKVVSECDITNTDQTVKYPEIHTTAVDGDTKTHAGTVKEKATIIDTVTYSNLVVGEIYTISGVLMDSETEKPLLENGNQITAEITFEADKTDGTKDLVYTLDSTLLKGKSTVVFEDLKQNDILVTSHANINDKDQTVSYPAISTQAKSDTTGIQVVPLSDSENITDIVSYSNLIPGTKYTLTGTIVDQANGKEIVTAEAEFTPSAANGTATVQFTKINTNNLIGKQLVIYEELKYGGTTVADHKDKYDKNQMIYVPKLSSQASNQANGTQVGLLKTDEKIKDVVEYSGLEPNVEYVITGTLMNKLTKEAVTDKDGNAITVTKKFTPTESSGKETVEFTYDSTLLPEGSTVVICQSISYTKEGKEIELADHSSLDNVSQSIYYPSIKTTAFDSQTKDNQGIVGKKVTVTDSVQLDNLVPGQEYTIKGILMNKATEGEYVDGDGNKVTGELTFKAEKSSEVKELSFTFNSSNIKGIDLVVFESLYYNGELAADHADFNDEKQTIKTPEIHTTAVDGDTKTHVGSVKENATIVDTVSYSNLIVGKEYTISGILMDKKTKDKLLVNGNEVTASVTFTAEKSEGTIDLVYTLDSSALEEKTVVVFEDLIHEGINVYTHANIDDKDQTVHYPKIGTTATINGSKSAVASSSTTIVDTVKYENLVPGQEYRLVGYLMDKNTGKELTINGRKITSEVTFTPDSESGSVNMKFTFDTSSLGGSKIVVFEELYCGSSLVTSHKDINSADQSVTITNPPTPSRPNTGDNNTALPYAMALAIAGIILASLIVYKKKTQK